MSNSIMRKIAKFIVEKHIIIMLLFVVLGYIQRAFNKQGSRE